LYLVEVLTYGTRNPIKVGVSRDVAKRISQFGAMGIHCPKLLGHFPFATEREAYSVETEVRHAFPSCPRYGARSREILDATFEDLIAFIAARARSPVVLAEAAA
jgi:hypothetical protein